MLENVDDILTVSDVCKKLKMGENMVYKLLKNGTIKSVRVGRKYLIPKDYIISFIKSNSYWKELKYER